MYVKSKDNLRCQFLPSILFESRSLFYLPLCLLDQLLLEIPGILLFPPSMLTHEHWDYRYKLLQSALHGF